MEISPIKLVGRAVRLEPLNEDHVPDLAIAGKDERIWRYMLYGNLSTEDAMHKWVKEMLMRQARGTDLPFAVIDNRTDRAIGCTRYMDIRPKDRGLEIGGTWFAVEYQRTAANTESKFLLLQYAFEIMGCIRVQLKTDTLNIPSQRAIERLGAVKEGIFRNHMILNDGRVRDSIFYSIIDTDWPEVKQHLQAKLRAYEVS